MTLDPRDDECRSTVGRSLATSRRCPVCDASENDVLFDNRMASIAEIDFSYEVAGCASCGMVYASRAPDDATIDRYYRDFSKYDHPSSADDLGASDRDRAAVAAAFTRRFIQPGARVLDIGCSIGLYLSTLRGAGAYDVRGLDPSCASADVARRLFDVQVEVGDAYTFDRYASFDCIALLAVLEHLRDPGRLIEKVARSMKPGAILVIEVPNADEFCNYPGIGRLTEPFGEFSNEHINFFGSASLSTLAARAGLSRIASEPFPYLIGIRGLLAVFRKGVASTSTKDGAEESAASIRRYVAASASALKLAHCRLADAGVRDRPTVLYGAGSHSARMLAQGPLGQMTIDLVLDRNPHLTGQTIGGRRIALPEALATRPGLPVVVSSFNAQAAIADYLRRHFDNEIVTLYPETEPAGSGRSSRADGEHRAIR